VVFEGSERRNSDFCAFVVLLGVDAEVESFSKCFSISTAVLMLVIVMFYAGASLLARYEV